MEPRHSHHDATPRPERTDRPENRNGQALIEFLVGLLVVVLLVAGLLQIVELSSAESELLGEVRGEAGRSAMLSSGVSSLPDYLETWEEGEDGLRYTADDEPVADSPQGLQSRIVAYSVDAPSDWIRLDDTVNNGLAELRGGPLPSTVVGFAHADRRRTVDLLPAIRAWVYGKDSVEVEAEVWLPQLGGMY